MPLNPRWQPALTETLSRLKKPDQALRLAIVGVGHELRGDDAAGTAVARLLQPLYRGTKPLLILDGGAALENVTGALRRFSPDLVLLIDAAQMDQQPGTVCWLDPEETTGFSASTHTLQPSVFAAYLKDELHCTLSLIGIQPASTDIIGAPLTEPVYESVAEVLQHLYTILPDYAD